jgi:hypothetical protein
MKFTDLPPTNRSILAALCAAGAAGLRTDALGRCTSPRHSTPQEAANLLNNLRQLGLVYSQQKPDNQSYALWKASEYGVAVFMSRPDEVPAPGKLVDPRDITDGVNAGHSPTRLRKWMVYPGGMQFQGTEEALATELSKCAEGRPGVTFLAYVLHSEALLPVPKAQITLL